MPDVLMPRLSDTMTEGFIAGWLKLEGETVQRGEPLAEIETDKATMELEAYDNVVLSSPNRAPPSRSASPSPSSTIRPPPPSVDPQAPSRQTRSLPWRRPPKHACQHVNTTRTGARYSAGTVARARPRT